MDIELADSASDIAYIDKRIAAALAYGRMADPIAARARPQMRGVFPVLVTPFDEHGELDLAGLERCVDFCLEAGAHGVVALVNASEFTTLSDDGAAPDRRPGRRGGRRPGPGRAGCLGRNRPPRRRLRDRGTDGRCRRGDRDAAVRARGEPRPGPRLLPRDRGRLGPAGVHPELPRVPGRPAHGRRRHRARVLDRRRRLREGGGAAGRPADERAHRAGGLQPRGRHGWLRRPVRDRRVRCAARAGRCPPARSSTCTSRSGRRSRPATWSGRGRSTPARCRC